MVLVIIESPRVPRHMLSDGFTRDRCLMGSLAVVATVDLRGP